MMTANFHAKRIRGPMRMYLFFSARVFSFQFGGILSVLLCVGILFHRTEIAQLMEYQQNACKWLVVSRERHEIGQQSTRENMCTNFHQLFRTAIVFWREDIDRTMSIIFALNVKYIPSQIQHSQRCPDPNRSDTNFGHVRLCDLRVSRKCLIKFYYFRTHFKTRRSARRRKRLQKRKE